MGKRRRRRLFRRMIRLALWLVLVFGALLGLAATAASGHPMMGFFIVPLMMLLTLAATPFVLMGLVVLVAAVALPFVVMAAIFGGPLYLLYRVSGARGVRSRRVDDEDDEGERLSPDALLRRRYVAGEITYVQFQQDMIGLLRDRFARGAIALGEYEAELEKLMAPARHLDVKRDPALSGAPLAD